MHIKKRFLSFLFLFTFLITGLFSLSALASAEPVAAEGGVLDLRDWNPEKSPVLSLKGDWRFFPDEFINPLEIPEGGGYSRLPGYWSQFIGNGNAQGFESLALTVLLPEDAPELAIKLTDVETSFLLFADGEEVMRAGLPGTDEESTLPYSLSQTARISPGTDELSLVLHSANFHHKKAGIWEEILFGEAKALEKEHDAVRYWETALVSAILVIGLYHLGLFLSRHSDKEALYFGLFCLLMSLRSLVTGELLLFSIMPQRAFEVLHKGVYLSYFLGVPVFLLYLKEIFREDVSRRIIRVFLMLSGLFALLVLVTPLRLYSRSVVAFHAVTLTAGAYTVFVLIQAVKRKREGALILSFSFMFMFLIVVNDILFSQQVIATGYHIPVGILVFIPFQAFLISHRATVLFRTVEMQADQLKKTNASFLKELKERRKLQAEVENSQGELERSRVGIIIGLAQLAEYRDEDTGGHLERIREYARVLARKLSEHPVYTEYITDNYIEDLYLSAILHDIGKVGIPDSILLKPARLTDEEFDQMKTHTTIGGDAILSVESRIESRSFLTLGKELAYYHHERWDGSGYPKGLKGENIPLSARILSLADVYDALTSVRPYKRAFSHNEAVRLIREGRGSQFDPLIVDTFLANLEEFNAIRQKLADE